MFAAGTPGHARPRHATLRQSAAGTNPHLIMAIFVTLFEVGVLEEGQNRPKTRSKLIQIHGGGKQNVVVLCAVAQESLKGLESAAPGGPGGPGGLMAGAVPARSLCAALTGRGSMHHSTALVSPQFIR